MRSCIVRGCDGERTRGHKELCHCPGTVRSGASWRGTEALGAADGKGCGEVTGVQPDTLSRALSETVSELSFLQILPLLWREIAGAKPLKSLVCCPETFELLAGWWPTGPRFGMVWGMLCC